MNKKLEQLRDHKDSNYFQGILQLRSPNEEILAFLRRELKENRHKVFVGREKKVSGGIDLYLSSNKFAINTGNRLYKAFGGVLKINEKLFTRNRQTSKDVYRMTVLYRPLGFIIGDVVFSGGKVMKVRGIGKKISGKNLATGRIELVDTKKDGVRKLEIFKTTVSKIYPEVEVIHPETFQSVKAKSLKKPQLGEKVKVVLQDDVLIVV